MPFSALCQLGTLSTTTSAAQCSPRVKVGGVVRAMVISAAALAFPSGCSVDQPGFQFPEEEQAAFETLPPPEEDAGREPPERPADSGPAPPDQPEEEPSVGSACQPEEVQPCGPNTIAGSCELGSRSCIDGAWGQCEGAVYPAERNCSSPLDRDCDGKPDDEVDDTCRCVPGSREACDAHPGLDGNGPCQAGSRECLLASDGASSDWGPCQGAVGPAERDGCELEGDDANCDGTPNGDCACLENTEQPCGSDVGECQSGRQLCREGRLGACEGAVLPAPRDCESVLDKDCDGRADHTVDDFCTCQVGTTEACSEHPGRDGNGPCRAGVRRCLVGADGTTSARGPCIGAVGPALADSCSEPGDDANCDGIANGGCECLPSEGNAGCSGTPEASVCSADGTCVSCQVDDDCALVSAGRQLCGAGRCVQCTSDADCTDATGSRCDSLTGECVAAAGVCEACSRAAQCDEPATHCALEPGSGSFRCLPAASAADCPVPPFVAAATLIDVGGAPVRLCLPRLASCDALTIEDGAPCTADAGCQAGTECVLPAGGPADAGGPGIGTCTLPCLVNGDCPAPRLCQLGICSVP